MPYNIPVKFSCEFRLCSSLKNVFIKKCLGHGCGHIVLPDEQRSHFPFEEVLRRPDEPDEAPVHRPDFLHLRQKVLVRPGERCQKILILGFEEESRLGGAPAAQGGGHRGLRWGRGR